MPSEINESTQKVKHVHSQYISNNWRAELEMSFKKWADKICMSITYCMINTFLSVGYVVYKWKCMVPDQFQGLN